MRGRWSLALAVSALASCAPASPGPVSEPRYVVGVPYQMGSVWSYPKEDFALRETGLAAIIEDSVRGRRTANGEIYDPALLTAEHRTLQLPAVVRVTNLENGLELTVRVNDRGPSRPGRTIAVSRRAAGLLKLDPRGGTQISIVEDDAASRALAASLPHDTSSALQISAAPRDALQAEALPALAGTRAATVVRQAPQRGLSIADLPSVHLEVPLELPVELRQSAARPGSLWIRASTFTNRQDAYRQAARIGGRVESVGQGRAPEYRVQLGPFGSVQQADSALEAVLRSGVSDARIVVD